MAEVGDRALKMLSTALAMEEKGERFYEKAATTCRSEQGKWIFGKLRDDEIVHMDRIKRIYRSLEGGRAWSEEWKTLKTADDLAVLFRRIATEHGPKIEAHPSDLEALDIGLDFELGSVKFYEKHLKRAAEPLECEFLERMIVEEKGHHAALSDMKFYLTNPVGWFREKERSGLDGA